MLHDWETLGKPWEREQTRHVWVFTCIGLLAVNTLMVVRGCLGVRCCRKCCCHCLCRLEFDDDTIDDIVGGGACSATASARGRIANRLGVSAYQAHKHCATLLHRRDQPMAIEAHLRNRLCSRARGGHDGDCGCAPAMTAGALLYVTHITVRKLSKAKKIENYYLFPKS
eukprot:COSAG05_NODE_272_length_12454_cov_1460.218085_3_plen_169_part_00